jgi:hypothetical protein
MEINLPEELSAQRVHEIVTQIKVTRPTLYAELLPVLNLTEKQKLKILDNMLMDHPHIYSSFFKSSQ